MSDSLINHKEVLNIGNSIFKGYNDNNGIMICGYEFGESKSDADIDTSEYNDDAVYDFFDKSPRFTKNYHFPYDESIKKYILDLWDLNERKINFLKNISSKQIGRLAHKIKKAMQRIIKNMMIVSFIIFPA